MLFDQDFLVSRAGQAYNFFNLLVCTNIKVLENKNGHLSVVGKLGNGATIRYSEVNSGYLDEIQEYLTSEWNSSTVNAHMKTAIAMHFNLDIEKDSILFNRIGGEQGGFVAIIKYGVYTYVLEITNCKFYSQKLYLEALCDSVEKYEPPVKEEEFYYDDSSFVGGIGKKTK